VLFENQLFSNCNRAIMMYEGWKAHLELENNCKSMNLWIWDKKKLLFDTFVTHVILYGCEVWGYNISRESWRKIKQIHKCFITYSIKIKGNTPCSILLIKASPPRPHLEHDYD
jgi:hypothetical protein